MYSETAKCAVVASVHGFICLWGASAHSETPVLFLRPYLAGGEGVVTKTTVPRVDDYFGAITKEQRNERRNERSEGTQESILHKELMAEKSQMMASTSNAEYQVKL